MKNRITLQSRICIGLLLVWGCAAQAQVSREQLLAHPHGTAAHYTTYPDSVPPQTPPPVGYEPFYLSHYGRHGSRYHVSESAYAQALRPLQKVHELGLLTELGESLRQRVARLAADAAGRAGSLSPRGAAEHKAIAERMYRNFPAIFAAPVRIEARSTTAPRCILSMAANNERLKELNPGLQIVRTADEGDMDFLRNTPYMLAEKKRMNPCRTEFLRGRPDPGRFMASLFRADAGILMEAGEQYAFMNGIYAMYAIAGCAGHLGISLGDIFTPEELFTLWQGQNILHYMQCANSPRFGAGVLADARPLLRDIVARADSAIAGGQPAADLRFGHDIALAPLVALIGLDGRGAECGDPARLHEVWSDFKVMPMAANLQFVFFRSKRSDEILVKILHNESEGRLPLDSPAFPYYRWRDVRTYLLNLLNSQS